MLWSARLSRSKELGEGACKTSVRGVRAREDSAAPVPKRAPRGCFSTQSTQVTRPRALLIFGTLDSLGASSPAGSWSDEQHAQQGGFFSHEFASHCPLARPSIELNLRRPPFLPDHHLPSSSCLIGSSPSPAPPLSSFNLTIHSHT